MGRWWWRGWCCRQTSSSRGDVHVACLDYSAWQAGVMLAIS